jgi:hypothetical protein
MVCFAFIAGASGVLSLEPSDLIIGWGSFGSDSFMAVGGPLTSAPAEETEDRSERRLAVLVADRTDGSELAEDTDGDSLPGDG